MTFNAILEAKISGSKSFQSLLTGFFSGNINSAKAIGFVNPFSYPLIANDDEVRDGFDFFFIDGGLLCSLSNLFRSPTIDRVSFDFSSIAHDVFSACDGARLRVALIGGTPDDIRKAVSYLSARYPRVNFVFAESGYFSDIDTDAKIEGMIKNGVQVAIVGLGTPKQERFILRFREKAKDPSLLFTCGGFLTQTALSGDYYPNWVKKSGLRWLYRAMGHSHVRKRLLKDYPKFGASYLASGICLSIARKWKL